MQGQHVLHGLWLPVRARYLVILLSVILSGGSRTMAGASAPTPTIEVTTLSLASPAQAPPGQASASESTKEAKTGRLVAWWTLDEADGDVAADSSGRDFAGTRIGKPQWQPAGGRVKGALAFDGTAGFVAIKDAPAFGITGALTVAAWIKVNRFDKRWQTIVAKGDTAWRLQRTAEEDGVAFHCTGLTAVDGRWPLGIESRKRVNDGQWHHVAGVYDGAVIALYLDGALDNSSRASGTIQTNKLPVSIGDNAETSGRNWSGLIDEVCVFACALNAGGVKALYSGQDPTVLAEQASALVSDDDVQAELRAGGKDRAHPSPSDTNVAPSERRGGRRWPLAVLLLAGVALTAGVYVVQRWKNGL